MNKWNYKLQDYELYTVPKNWFCPLYCNDMEERINCCRCGKVITFGESYTSKEIQNDFGMGYPICKNCQQLEYVFECDHMSKDGEG